MIAAGVTQPDGLPVYVASPEEFEPVGYVVVLASCTAHVDGRCVALRAGRVQRVTSAAVLAGLTPCRRCLVP